MATPAAPLAPNHARRKIWRMLLNEWTESFCYASRGLFFFSWLKKLKTKKTKKKKQKKDSCEKAHQAKIKA
jgi:hypothetical protein